MEKQYNIIKKKKNGFKIKIKNKNFAKYFTKAL